LGLWVVFNLVKSLGAEISISSPAENSQCGTTATINFPLSSTV
jgi:signal transduction histidine kinase